MAAASALRKPLPPATPPPRPPPPPSARVGSPAARVGSPPLATPVAVTGAGRNVREGTETRLPLPRFVSLKAERVNVRRGPSSEHQIAWVFTKKGLPVEIVAEFEQWRRIRDSEGSENGVFHSMLTGKRTAMVAPWKKNRASRCARRPSTMLPPWRWPDRASSPTSTRAPAAGAS